VDKPLDQRLLARNLKSAKGKVVGSPPNRRLQMVYM
jgi:hypothetical protein